MNLDLLISFFHCLNENGYLIESVRSICMVSVMLMKVVDVLCALCVMDSHWRSAQHNT